MTTVTTNKSTVSEFTRVDEANRWIIASNFDALCRAVAKENEHLGFDCYQVKATGKKYVDHTTYVRCMEVNIKCAFPNSNKYEVIGCVDHINHLILGEATQQYQFTNHCEICNKTITRNTTYIVNDLGENKTIEVGGSCLKKITGVSAFNKISRIVTHNMLQEMTYETYSACIDSEGGSYNPRKCLIETDEVINVAYAIIAKRGFAPSSHIYPTKQRMFDVLLTPAGDEGESYDGCEDVSAKIRAFVLGLEDNSDFTANYKLIAGSERINYNAFGFVAAMVNQYNKHIEKELAIQARIQSNGYFEKFESEGYKFKGAIHATLAAPIKAYLNEYGYTYVVHMIDSMHHHFVWQTSNPKFVNEYDKQYAGGTPVGLKLVIRGFTVKHYKETTEGMYTYITRAKVELGD